MNAGTRAAQGGIREQILNFLSLSSDIARNQYDSEFSESGGQIIYCFDQTIFNLFFDTVEWRHAVASFYRESWTGSRHDHRDGKDDRQRIEAQSALIAAEHLLSEDLPAAKNRNIYLTPWHRHELALRLKQVAERIDRGEIDGDKIEQEIKAKLRFLTLSRQSRSDPDGNLFERDPVLERDLEQLGKSSSPNAFLLRYELTRRAAAMLVQCEESEQLDQIHRLVSRPLRQRIKSLHQLFRPSPSDTQAIAVDARKWYLRILSESEGDGRHRKSRRSSGAMWNDARSLAFVRWAARMTRPDQRLVLVTSDDRVFDAYRGWWCDEGFTDEGEPEPFILRRSFQYTPIFNFRDSRNDLSCADGLQEEEIRKLFRQIAQAVRLTLLPFNLAETIASLGALAQNRSFQYVALRGKHYRENDPDPVLDYFFARVSSNWYEEQKDAIEEIGDLWRDMERIGIGFFYDQVIKRLEDDQHLFGLDDTGNADPRNAEEALRYLSRVLATITKRTRMAYLPMAQAFLQEPEGPVGAVGRAPDLLWYRLPSRHSVYDMIRSWPKMADKERSELVDELGRIAEAPFILASAFALARHDWWKAEEFADYALTAFQAGDGTAPLVLAELLFLAAFTKRFRLGSSGLTEHVGREDLVRSAYARSSAIYSSAEELLEQLVSHLGSLKPGQETALHRVRALSERAALRLFMALHLHFTPEGRDETTDLSPLDLVIAAQADIIECWRIDKTVSATDLRSRKMTVRSHFLHNAAASEVVRFLVSDSEFSLDPRLAPVVRDFGKGPYRQSESADALAKAERITFEILQGTADPLEWPEFEAALAEMRQGSLTLDRKFAHALSAKQDELFCRLTATPV